MGNRGGNIEEWVLSYFFDGAESASELQSSEVTELEDLVNAVASWAGLPLPEHLASWAGKNPGASTRDSDGFLAFGRRFEGFFEGFAAETSGLKCFRMRNDPFPAIHRPLMAYVTTAFVAPAFGHQAKTVETEIGEMY